MVPGRRRKTANPSAGTGTAARGDGEKRAPDAAKPFVLLSSMWLDSALRRAIRPAVVRAGIVKHIGWHTFRRSFATMLKANGEDVKVVQESLRHTNSKITLELYTQGLMATKRQAQGRVVKSLLLPRVTTPATSVSVSA
jgi:integrase